MHFFSSIDAVISSFFVPSFEELYAYQSLHISSKRVSKPGSSSYITWNPTSLLFEFTDKDFQTGQQLFVFPDLRTMSALIPHDIQMNRIHSQLSPIGRKKIFHQIRTGEF
jgi:hypothetical protein